MCVTSAALRSRPGCAGPCGAETGGAAEREGDAEVSGGGGATLGARGAFRRNVTGSGAAEVNTSSSSWIDGKRARTTTTSSVPDLGVGGTGFALAISSSAQGSRMGWRGVRDGGLRDAIFCWLPGGPKLLDDGMGGRADGVDEPPVESGGGGALDGSCGPGAAPSRASRNTENASPFGVGGGGGTASGGIPKVGGGGIPLGPAWEELPDAAWEELPDAAWEELPDAACTGDGDGVDASGDAPNATVVPPCVFDTLMRSAPVTSVVSSPSSPRGASSGWTNPGGGGCDDGRAGGRTELLLAGGLDGAAPTGGALAT